MPCVKDGWIDGKYNQRFKKILSIDQRSIFSKLLIAYRLSLNRRSHILILVTY